MDSGPYLISERKLFENNPEDVNKGYGWAKRFLEQKFLLLSEFNNFSLKIEDHLIFMVKGINGLENTPVLFLCLLRRF